MVSYLIRRITAMLPTLLIVLIVSFFLIHLIPGDPASVMLGPYATVDQVEQLQHAMGLDQLIMVQLANYESVVLGGDLGQSN